MELLIPIVLLVAGLGILVLGAEWLVKGASSIASRFGISPLIIGLTVVAFGTSMPELTVNFYAAFTGATDIAIGNIIGSNIANILLILGVCAMVVPLSVQSSTVKWEIPFALLAVLLVFVMGNDRLFDGMAYDAITRTDGLALLGIFAVFMFYIFAIAKRDPMQEEGAGAKRVGPFLAIGLVLIGLAALILGGKLLVDNAVVLARFMGLSEAVIGLTVVAVGTSLPELATSLVAAFRKQVDIAVGNIVGSNIFNVFWILGATAVIAPLPASSGFSVDALVAVGATLMLLLALFIGKRGQLERWQGVVMLLAYIAYIAYLVI